MCSHAGVLTCAAYETEALLILLFGPSAFSIRGCKLWKTLPTVMKLITDQILVQNKPELYIFYI